MTKKYYTENFNPIGFYEVEPKPTFKELAKYYTEEYFQSSDGDFSPQYSQEELEYFHNLARVALETLRHFNIDKSLFDVGCGEGFFTKSFYDFGWKVSCVDFSKFAISLHNKEMLPFFSSGDLLEIIKYKIDKKEKYGLINLQNVLEHVIDPINVLEELKSLFNDNSIIRIMIPNDYSDFQNALIARGLTTNTWFRPPEHLSYFNKNGITNILHHCGYKILSLQADFPIEIFLANKHSNYWKDRSLGKEAHFARIFCENHLINTNIVDYIQYSQAASKLGFGRELIIYATLV